MGERDQRFLNKVKKKTAILGFPKMGQACLSLTCHHDWPGEHCARIVVDGCLPLTEVGLAIERLERLAHVVVDLEVAA